MAHKEMVYIKGYAKGKGFNQLLKAINCASIMHEGQFRKSGEPYIDHPMRITNALISLGVDDDITLATAIMHDVIEDCEIISLIALEKDYGISSEVLDLVLKLSKTDKTFTEYYYDVIAIDIRTILVKIADRCHNVSTMAGAFNMLKIKNYIDETERYVLPLCKRAIQYHPEYSDIIYTMQYHIESILRTIKAVMLGVYVTSMPLVTVNSDDVTMEDDPDEQNRNL